MASEPPLSKETTYNKHGYAEKSENTRAICEPRWVGWPKKNKRDRCDTFPLREPCIFGGRDAEQSKEKFNAWVENRNKAAEAIEIEK